MSRRRWVAVAGAAASSVAAVMLQRVLVQVRAGAGPSMAPTMSQDGQVYLVNRWSALRRKLSSSSDSSSSSASSSDSSSASSSSCWLSVGDVVVLRSPLDREQGVVKRVVGLPRQRVRTRLVDRDEPVTVLVPPGHVWVEGDNAHASRDSRLYGPVSLDDVLGRVFWNVYPKFGPLPPRPQQEEEEEKEEEEQQK
eukprot:TRINITY_DN66425_c11_g1_i1.p1 TRINITY_DN66425_c11_g1~~TRINITY_DN66425_c11_g1_i1.p1  ORF type:complete len:195 (+),score=58.12 TRINITY_DN66425_c11_g1_i1:71-655(+)